MSPFLFFGALTALIAGAALLWALRAYRRAGGTRRRAALAAGALAALAVGGAYLALGRPGEADQPLAQRLDELRTRDTASYTPEEWVARLAFEARANPSDARPHVAIGLLLASQQRPEEAARAFDAALRRDPTSLLALVGLGRAMVAMDDGRVSSEAQRIFAEAARLDPEDPTAWLYQALGAQQDGRRADAARLWSEVLRRLPADDPRRAMAERMISDNSAPQSAR